MLLVEWGPAAAGVVGGCAVVVVVDVLSFTTALSVAADRGVEVVPCAPGSAVASGDDVVVAGRRSSDAPVSLSPASIRAAGLLTRLVLPSPNGSAISAALASRGVTVVGASLRNRRAVAAWVSSRFAPSSVAVVPAGERWADGSLRPAVEDLWGAGAVIASLPSASLSPEARSAVGAFEAVATDLPGALCACVSGRELRGMGFPQDVDVAGELDEGSAVPVLRDGVFLPE